MIAEELDALYRLLRGNKAAAKVLDARTLAQADKITEMHQLVLEARESYLASRSRYLKPGAEEQIKGRGQEAEQRRRTAVRKHEKTIEVIEAFDELMPEIDKMLVKIKSQAAREKAVQAKDAQGKDAPRNADSKSQSTSDQPISDQAVSIQAESAAIDPPFIQAFQAANSDEVFDLVHDRFDFFEIRNADDVQQQTLYLIHRKGKSYLIQTGTQEDDPPQGGEDEVELCDQITHKPMKPMSVARFLDLGAKRQIVRLTPRLK